MRLFPRVRLVVGAVLLLPGCASDDGATDASTGEETATEGNASGGGPGDDYTKDVRIVVHDEVNTILVVTWEQAIEVDDVWLEFSFEAGNVMTSRPKPGTLGMHRDVVLGVPGATVVAVRIVSRQGSSEHRSIDFEAMTDPLPSRMPTPTVTIYEPDLASPDRWLFGAVEDTDCGAPQGCYYRSTFWLYIMDRQGRIVWYYADPASNATSSFQRRARDGEYILIEKRPFRGEESRLVVKTTLDGEYRENLPLPVADCIDVTDSGSILYNTGPQLYEIDRDRQIRPIWNCRTQFGEDFECYTNTVNWNQLDDTVLLSFPYQNTVVEIDRASGTLVGQYGDAPGSFAFMPSSWDFEFQHFANVTQDGTLLVSSHMPGHEDTTVPLAGEHAFMEFTIDRENQTLVEKWIYTEGPEWAAYKGMAIRMPNGNTLANYGTGGVIREITPDKQTAFRVQFDLTPEEDGDDADFFNKMVGHNELIDDLYALNGGGPS